mmetsp:Transcript_125398/g.313299  ORF Transcript_125398/g.313299 Transcript_125398/m.313299 type:complete len:246 (+) Transcript_125398:271-1008(+)
MPSGRCYAQWYAAGTSYGSAITAAGSAQPPLPCRPEYHAAAATLAILQLRDFPPGKPQPQHSRGQQVAARRLRHREGALGRHLRRRRSLHAGEECISASRRGWAGRHGGAFECSAAATGGGSQLGGNHPLQADDWIAPARLLHRAGTAARAPRVPEAATTALLSDPLVAGAAHRPEHLRLWSAECARAEAGPTRHLCLRAERPKAEVCAAGGSRPAARAGRNPSATPVRALGGVVECSCDESVAS